MLFPLKLSPTHVLLEIVNVGYLFSWSGKSHSSMDRLSKTCTHTMGKKSGSSFCSHSFQRTATRPSPTSV